MSDKNYSLGLILGVTKNEIATEPRAAIKALLELEQIQKRVGKGFGLPGAGGININNSINLSLDGTGNAEAIAEMVAERNKQELKQELLAKLNAEMNPRKLNQAIDERIDYRVDNYNQRV